MVSGKFHNWLVVLTILKNMKVNGKDYPLYEMENRDMFKTTNQITIPILFHHYPIIDRLYLVIYI